MGRELPKKGGGAWTICRFRGAGTWQKRWGGVSEWGLIFQCTLWHENNLPMLEVKSRSKRLEH